MKIENRNIISCHHIASIYELSEGKSPGPLVPKSEQNQQWEENRPKDLDCWRYPYLPTPNRYNRKYTNNLTSHRGESRNSRADKMSGMKYPELSRSSSKRSYKKFYSAKRRIFLKNELFFDKI